MRTLRWMMLAGATILTVAPAAAQRFGGNYPICMQKWEWGGGSSIYCNYTSWEACKATASGLSAMCLVNSYWSQPVPGDGAFAGPKAPYPRAR